MKASGTADGRRASREEIARIVAAPPRPFEPSVLVVDDEEVLRELLVELLVMAGYRAYTAADVPGALRVLESVRPRVVLTDRNLPGGSGLTLVREGRRLVPDAQFLLMTGCPSLDNALDAIELGVFAYLPKPFRCIDELAERVAAALARSREAYEQQRVLWELACDASARND